VRDPRANAAGREHLLGDAELLHRFPDERELVRRVRYRKPGRQPGEGRVPAQEPQREGVKRPHEREERAAAEDPAGALAHLVRGLVRERHRDDRARVRSGLDETRQAMGDDPGLAGARAGEDEERPLFVEDRGLLVRVQSPECWSFVHDGNLAELRTENRD
jgi:hypothetical protein